MIPKAPDTLLLRLRYRLYRLRHRNQVPETEPMGYGMYRQCLWLKKPRTGGDP